MLMVVCVWGSVVLVVVCVVVVVCGADSCVVL